MAPSSVALQSVVFGAISPREAELLRLRGAMPKPGGPALQVTLATPRGPVTLTTSAS